MTAKGLGRRGPLAQARGRALLVVTGESLLVDRSLEEGLEGLIDPLTELRLLLHPLLEQGTQEDLLSRQKAPMTGLLPVLHGPNPGLKLVTFVDELLESLGHGWGAYRMRGTMSRGQRPDASGCFRLVPTARGGDSPCFAAWP